jgi:PAS domain S-box-containing protein
VESNRPFEQFGTLADLLPQIVWTARPDGARDYFNQRWYDYTGMSREQSEGWGWTAALHPDDLAGFTQAWREAVRDGRLLEQQYRLRRAGDRTYRWHLVRAAPVRAADGGAIKWVGASTDIDDQRRTEEVLETQARALRDQARLLDLANDGIFARDLSGIITFWNRGAERLYGFTRHEAFGKNVGVLLKTEFAEPYEQIQAAILGSGRWEGSLIHRRKDGSVLSVESRWALQCDARGQPVAILEINRDITSRKRAEEALARTAAELRRSNQELEVFASVASHDLQEPLRVIASYTQLLVREYGDQLDGGAHQLVAVILQGTRRMHALINDLLTYSRLGTRTKTFGPVDCSALLRTVLKNLEVSVRETAAVIQVGVLPTISGDESQLSQLFQNLISNALKFHGPRPPEISISAEFEAPDWRFEVRDNGIGIDPKYHERIFVVFQRLHGREEFPGTGIGLAICKRIVEHHQGRIWVESTLGKGATFRFTLPGASPRAAADHI